MIVLPGQIIIFIHSPQIGDFSRDSKFLVRMRNEEKIGKQEEPTHISVGSKFEDFPVFENCQSELKTLKQDAVNILKIVVNMMGSKERQPTMKMSHYPQSRFVQHHN